MKRSNVVSKCKMCEAKWLTVNELVKNVEEKEKKEKKKKRWEGAGFKQNQGERARDRTLNPLGEWQPRRRRDGQEHDE